MMTIDRRDIGRIIEDLKTTGTDTQNVEVKESVRKLPASLVETLSAFSNTSGGTLVLGLSEANGFAPAPEFRAKTMADALATTCSDKMMPPVRPEIEITDHGGAQLVVAHIPECIPRDKPCYVAARGMYNGSYARVADGDRKLSSYEVDRLLENRLQPSFDIEPVDKASMADLDQDLVRAVLSYQRQIHPRIFSALSDEDALASLHVAVRDEDGRLVPTLAGLLALGVYPQSFFPRLTVAFTAYGNEGKHVYAEKYLDARTMAGPIPALLEDTLAALRRNMRVGGVLNDETQLREDVPEFPLGAVREAVANALMHRDYSPMARGTAVQVGLYPDRLEVSNPGGIYGTLTVEDLGKPGCSSTRNQFLASILESVPFQNGYMVENRGTGYRFIQQELLRAGLQPPEVHDSISAFSLVMRKLPSAHEHASQGPHNAVKQAVEPRKHDELLDYLSRVPDASTSELASNTGLARSTISYRLRKLEEEGLIERIGQIRSPKQRYRLSGKMGQR